MTEFINGTDSTSEVGQGNHEGAYITPIAVDLGDAALNTLGGAGDTPEYASDDYHTESDNGSGGYTQRL